MIDSCVGARSVNGWMMNIYWVATGRVNGWMMNRLGMYRNGEWMMNICICWVITGMVNGWIMNRLSGVGIGKVNEWMMNRLGYISYPFNWNLSTPLNKIFNYVVSE